MGGFSSPAKGKDVVLLKKELMDGVLLKPARGGDAVVGAVYVSIGKLLLFFGRFELMGRTRRCHQRREMRFLEGGQDYRLGRCSFHSKTDWCSVSLPLINSQQS